jgi:hypothetical protein
VVPPSALTLQAAVQDVSLAGQLSHVDALFIGDEVDDKLDAASLRGKLKEGLDAIAAVPRAVTYQAGVDHTHSRGHENHISTGVLECL